MKMMSKVVKKLVPFCIGIVLLILCGTGIGSVAADSSDDVYLGDIYLNVLYKNVGGIPIAGHETGWTNVDNSRSLSFTEDVDGYYVIRDGATSIDDSELTGTYSKAIYGKKQLMDVKYPDVAIAGYIYLNNDLSNPVGNLIGNTISTDYVIRLTVPATFGQGSKVLGMSLTNPDKSLSQIVGTKNGNTIEYWASLAEYEPGVWTVTPVFHSGSANGFSNLAPKYMYGTPVYFTVKQADNSIKFEVSKTTNPVSATPMQTASTPVATTTPMKNDVGVQQATPASTEAPVTSTQQSPAPFIGILAGFGVAAVLLRVRR